jgi:hypothetical protein
MQKILNGIHAHGWGIDVARSVRVEERTYRRLSQTSGSLQAILGRPVSLDEAIWHLLKGAREEGRISDLAGSWDMSDSELRETKRVLTEGWKRWELPQSA